MQKATKHPWSFLVVSSFSIRTASMNSQTRIHAADVWICAGRRERHYTWVHNEIWTSEFHVVNITSFHCWSHSTGHIYSWLAHYSCRQRWIVIQSVDRFHLWTTPADHFNLLLFRQHTVLFACKLMLGVKAGKFFAIPGHTCTHPSFPVLNLLCLFSVDTWGSLKPGAWQSRCTTVPRV